MKIGVAVVGCEEQIWVWLSWAGGAMLLATRMIEPRVHWSTGHTGKKFN